MRLSMKSSACSTRALDRISLSVSPSRYGILVSLRHLPRRLNHSELVKGDRVVKLGQHIPCPPLIDVEEG